MGCHIGPTFLRESLRNERLFFDLAKLFLHTNRELFKKNYKCDKQKPMKILTLIISLLTLNNIAVADEINISKQVNGTENKKCNYYLNGDLKQGSKIIMFLGGTGIYTTGSEYADHPIVSILHDEKKALILTIDKPGITYSKNSPNNLVLDESIYDLYTQDDLINCTINALNSVITENQELKTSDIYFLAHSEGTQIATRTLKKIIRDNLVLQAQIKGFFLSGLVMNSWKDIINFQINDPKENQSFWTAFQNKDDSTLKSYGDLAYKYWSNILSTESNEDTLKSLVALKPNCFFSIYQGLNDENTIVKPVMDFESWNRQQKKQGLDSLRIASRYYQADHNLNLAAMNDIIFALETYLGN